MAKETNDEVKCICESSEDTGDMLECEICLRWSHYVLV